MLGYSAPLSPGVLVFSYLAAENPFKRRRLPPLCANSGQNKGAAPSSASLQADIVPGSCHTHKPLMSAGATTLCVLCCAVHESGWFANKYNCHSSPLLCASLTLKRCDCKPSVYQALKLKTLSTGGRDLRQDFFTRGYFAFQLRAIFPTQFSIYGLGAVEICGYEASCH